MGKVTTKIERMENTRNKGHWYKRDRNIREGGGSFGGRRDGYEDMVASGQICFRG